MKPIKHISIASFILFLIVFFISSLIGSRLSELISSQSQLAGPAVLTSSSFLNTTYFFDDQNVEGIEFPTRIRGVVYYPEDFYNRHSPLVLISHGNSQNCVNPVDGQLECQAQGACNLGWEPRPLAEGISYIAEQLALNGMIAVSIDVAQLSYCGGDPDTMGTLEDSISRRTSLIKKHLSLWNEWATVGGEPFGTSFVDKVDLKHVGLVGHSNGGEAIASVPAFLENSPLSDVKVGSLYFLASSPINFSIPDVSYSVLLAGCDNEFPEHLPGLDIYDRGLSERKTARASQLLAGANHGSFNELTENSLSACTASLIGGEAQRKIASRIISFWFNSTLSSTPQDMDHFITGEAPVPQSIIDSVGFEPDIRVAYSDPGYLLLDNFSFFENPPEAPNTPILPSNLLGGVITFSGFSEVKHCIYHGCNIPPWNTQYYYQHQKPSYRLSWDGGLPINRWGLANGDFSDYETISFRVAQQVNNNWNPPGGEQDFIVRLRDSEGNTAEVNVSEVGSIPYPYNNYEDACSLGCNQFLLSVAREVLHTIRVPLSVFGERNPELNLDSLADLEFQMTATPKGRILLSDIEFTIQQFTLTTSVVGQGNITGTGISCGTDTANDCSQTENYRTEIVLTATPVAGGSFSGWTGCDSFSGNNCTVILDQAENVQATFSPTNYQLMVNKIGNGFGNVSSVPSGIDCGVTCNANFVSGASVTLTPTTQTGSTFIGWGGACRGSGACNVLMDEQKSVTAMFALRTFILTASAGAGGTIAPSGSISVTYGGNQTFIFVPAPDYHIVEVLVDGVSMGVVTSYTFTNVTASHTISVSFAPDNQAPQANAGIDQIMTLPSTASLDGTVSDDGLPTNTLTSTWSKVSGLGTVTFGNANAIDTTAGFSLAGSYILRLDASDGALAANDTLVVIVNPAPLTTYTLTASYGTNGTLSPSGTVVVNQGASQTFTVVPAAGYQIASVLVDGINVGAVSTYTFINIQANHTISASFSLIPPVDTLVPSVAITSPLNGGRVAQGQRNTITASASDNVGVTRVRFFVNGALQCTDTRSPYTCGWSVPPQAGLTYQLKAQAVDAAGNLGNSTIVTVTSQ